jgi:LDH2 family malate/lactate/ureidoglycolate dehydrogenase
VIALDVGPFRDPADFAAEVEAVCGGIKATAPADGYDDVLLPGEAEQRSRQRRLAEGIPVAESTWRELRALAERLGVAV